MRAEFEGWIATGFDIAACLEGHGAGRGVAPKAGKRILPLSSPARFHEQHRMLSLRLLHDFDPFSISLQYAKNIEFFLERDRMLLLTRSPNPALSQ
jgi:hypothetical protein